MCVCVCVCVCFIRQVAVAFYGLPVQLTELQSYQTQFMYKTKIGSRLYKNHPLMKDIPLGTEVFVAMSPLVVSISFPQARDGCLPQTSHSPPSTTNDSRTRTNKLSFRNTSIFLFIITILSCCYDDRTSQLYLNS